MKKVAQTLIKADKFYTIANANEKVIEAVEGEANGAAIQLGTYDKKHNQMWAFISGGEGVYRIQNRATGKMMDLMMNGTANGTWLHQWEDTNGSSQLWIVENGSDGTVKIKAQMSAEKCIDVVGISNEDGARIQIWQDVNGENQKWIIAEVKERKARTTKKAAEAVEGEEKAVKKTTTRKTTKKAAEAAEGEEKAVKKTTTRKTTKKAAETAEGEAKPAKKTTRKTTKKAEAEKVE